MTRIVAMVTCLLMLIGPWHASDVVGEEPPPPGSIYEQDYSVVPLLKVDAASNGKASARGGAELLLPRFAGGWLPSVTVFGKVETSSGVSQLLAFSDGDVTPGLPWALGATSSFEDRDLSVTNSPDFVRVRALSVCRESCEGSDGRDSARCKNILALLQEQWVSQIEYLGDDASQFVCVAGQAKLNDDDAAGAAKECDSKCVGAVQRSALFCDWRQHHRTVESGADLATHICDAGKDALEQGRADAALKVCDAECAGRMVKYCVQRWQYRTGEGTVQVASEVGEDELCDAGQQEFKAWRVVETPELMPYFPTQKWVVGFDVGQQRFSYLVQQGDELRKREEDLAHGSAGVKAIFVPWQGDEVGFTIEGLVGYEGVASLKGSRNVQYCPQVGEISVGEGAPAVPVEACTTAALASDSSTEHSATAAIYGGFIDSGANWRVSLGVRLERQFVEDVDRYTYAVELPAFVSFGSIRTTESQYEGIVQLKPSVAFVVDGDELHDTIGGVKLSLLGERLLFSSEFDEL